MSLRVITLVAVLGVLAFAFVAWNRNREAPPSTSSGGPAPESGAIPEAGSENTPSDGIRSAPASSAGVAWEKPERWLEGTVSAMRVATYTIPSSGGAANAQCAVYYFGPGQGGGVDANLERWAGEFEGGGRPERSSLTADGITVTRVRMSGTYQAHAGMAEVATGPRRDHILLGAIVEGPNGPLFFKLVGPAATVTPAEKEFDGMLRSLRRTGTS